MSRLPALVMVLFGLSTSVQAAAPTGPSPVALVFGGSDRAPHVGLLLGGWAGGAWQAPKAFVPRLKGRTTWRAQTLNGQSALTASTGLEPNGEPCPETVFMRFPGPAPASGFTVLTTPTLNARPRPVDVLSVRNAAYRQAVADELRRQGLPGVPVHLDSVTRTDLDGDGTAEVIIAASRFQGANGADWPASSFAPPPQGKTGDYSLLLLRWLRQGQLRTTVLAASVFNKANEPGPTAGDRPIPSRADLAGVADLNGDGRMELVIADAYYEGEGATVVEWSPRAGPVTRLDEGCGA